MLAVGQELREAVTVVLALLVELGDRDRIAAGCRDAVDRRLVVGREQDHAVVVPGAALAVRRVAKRQGGTSRRGDLLELALGEERNGFPVRGPERVDRAVGPGKRLARQRVQVAHPQDAIAGFVLGHERQLGPVGRDRHRARARATQRIARSLGRRDESAHDALRTRGQLKRHDGQRHRGDSENSGRRPRQSRAGLAPRGHRDGHTGLRAGVRDPLQLEQHVVHRLPALVGILGDTRPDQAVERGRRHGLQRRDRARLILEDRGDQAGLGLALERLASRGHLVEQHAEGEDVAPRVSFLALELLRRHVLEGPDNRARSGQRGRQGRRGGQGRVGTHGERRLGQTEVE